MKVVVKTMSKSIMVNIALVIIKLIAGLLCNYKSIVADAIHSLSDLSTDFVAIIGQKLATKKADANHPYGHGQIEYITSIAIGLFILFMGTQLFTSVFDGKIVTPKIPFVALMIVVMTIISKYTLVLYVRKKGLKANNHILLASAKESMAGVLSSIGVFIAVFLSLFANYIPILKYADKVGTALISLLILKTAYQILVDNIKAIIGECEKDENVLNKIRGVIMSVPGVIRIDNLKVMMYGSYYQILLDASADANCTFEEADEISNNIEKELLKSHSKIKYVFVHMNPYGKH